MCGIALLDQLESLDEQRIRQTLSLIRRNLRYRLPKWERP